MKDRQADVTYFDKDGKAMKTPNIMQLGDAAGPSEPVTLKKKTKKQRLIEQAEKAKEEAKKKRREDRKAARSGSKSEKSENKTSE